MLEEAKAALRAKQDRFQEEAAKFDLDLRNIAQQRIRDACPHDNCVDSGPREQKCEDCGEIFVYCNGCSSEDGLIYHTAPAHDRVNPSLAP
jgi:hypothetical protein